MTNPSASELLDYAAASLRDAKDRINDAHGILCDDSMLAAAALLPLTRQLADVETLCQQLVSDAQHHEQMLVNWQVRA